MAPTTLEEPQPRTNPAASLVDEVRQTSEKLRQLAEALQAREQAVQAREKAMEAREKEIAELLALKKIAYRFMAEDAIRNLPPLPEDVDLAALVKQEGWSQLKDFIDDL